MDYDFDDDLLVRIFDDDSNDDAIADDKDAGKKWENTHDHPKSRVEPPNSEEPMTCDST